MRRRLTAAALGLALLAAACGSGGERGSSATTAAANTAPPPPATTAATGQAGDTAAPSTAAPTTEAAKDPCAGVTLEATETGITADTITLMIMADTGSPLSPGLATGAVEAMKGWAAMTNANGGLACRKVVVEEYDSRLDANEVRNGYTKGCESAFAMVGTYSLFVADISAMSECPDKTGARIGIPEVPAVIQSTLQACNPSTFSFTNLGEPCPPQTGVRELTVTSATGEYIRSVVGDDPHGVFILASATPTLIQSAMANFRYMQNVQGIVPDVEAGAASTDTQDHFTPFATTMKDKGSNFVYFLPAFKSFIGLFQEAKSQGVDTVKLWLCTTTCYDPAFIKAGGSQLDGVQVILTGLPFEEADVSPAMKKFVDNVATHNTFSFAAWLSAELFATAVNTIVDEQGPNALTRANVIEALGKVKDFDAGGLIGPATPSQRIPATCIVTVEVRDGAFHRVFPAEPGTFHCTQPGKISIDPSTEFKG